MFDYREDITKYSDDELSLRVFNDEYYYHERKDWNYLKALIMEQFVYTDAQLETLINDLEEEGL